LRGSAVVNFGCRLFGSSSSWPRGAHASRARSSSQRSSLRAEGRAGRPRTSASMAWPAARDGLSGDPPRLPSGLRRSRSAARRAETHAGPAGLREPDGDRLLRRSRPVLALADVMDLLADELSGLGRRRLSFPPSPSCSPQRLLLGHDGDSSSLHGGTSSSRGKTASGIPLSSRPVWFSRRISGGRLSKPLVRRIPILHPAHSFCTPRRSA
jgi:hypothetical protein